MLMRTLSKIAITGTVAISAMATPVAAAELSLAYFMGAKHPMNKAVFTPFANKLAEVSGGKLTVKQYAGGALNSKPPTQYAILRKGVADIAFALPGYTAKNFPLTNVIAVPGMAKSALDGTKKLINARNILEKEYKAKVLAIWANQTPILLTKDRPVHTLADLKGMKIRVTAKQNVPFIEALGARALAQPVTVINQNLQNGTIDGILIDPSAIRSFKLYEPANYLTVGIPGSGSAFVLLMNQGTYDAMSDQEKKWVDAASGDELSLGGGKGYDAAAAKGMAIAVKNKVEIINLKDNEIASMKKAMMPVLEKFKTKKLKGGHTAGDIMKVMSGN